MYLLAVDLDWLHTKTAFKLLQQQKHNERFTDSYLALAM